MESYAAAAGDLQAVGKTEIRDERMLVKCFLESLQSEALCEVRMYNLDHYDKMLLRRR